MHRNIPVQGSLDRHCITAHPLMADAEQTILKACFKSFSKIDLLSLSVPALVCDKPQRRVKNIVNANCLQYFFV